MENFDEFWAVYPRKRDKLAAQRAYKRALKITSAAEILRGANLYAKERAGHDANYTKHPATWLNAGGFGNYPPEQPRSDSASGFYASFTSAELEAWDNYRLNREGTDWPRDKKGGWWFPTRWPPNYQEQAA